MRNTAHPVAILVVATACSQAPPPDNRPAPESLAAIEALYQARMDSARSRYNDADVHFMTGMIIHHAQALVMAGLAPENGASPIIQTLCARIINAQRDEIATMQTWLRDRNEPVPHVNPDGTMHMTGADGHMHMPGMLSAEQMEQLRNARGTDFDRTFLELMIQHHEGAVTMVHELFATDGAAQGDVVFKMASDIQVDQITEIDRMKLMLEAMPGGAGNR